MSGDATPTLPFLIVSPCGDRSCIPRDWPLACCASCLPGVRQAPTRPPHRMAHRSAIAITMPTTPTASARLRHRRSTTRRRAHGCGPPRRWIGRERQDRTPAPPSAPAAWSAKPTTYAPWPRSFPPEPSGRYPIPQRRRPAAKPSALSPLDQLDGHVLRSRKEGDPHAWPNCLRLHGEWHALALQFRHRGVEVL